MDKKEEIKNKIEFAEESIEFYKRKVKESEEEKSELETELEKIEQEESQEWVPQEGEKYWTIDLDIMVIGNSFWHDGDVDNTRLQHKVIFKTEAEAEEYLEYLKAKEKAMNEFSKEEWENDNIEKYCIRYIYLREKFEKTYYTSIRGINTMYFRTRELAQEFIDKYEKFLKKELGV